MLHHSAVGGEVRFEYLWKDMHSTLTMEFPVFQIWLFKVACCHTAETVVAENAYTVMRADSFHTTPMKPISGGFESLLNLSLPCDFI